MSASEIWRNRLISAATFCKIMKALAIVAGFILLLDQGSKYFVVHTLNLIEIGRIDIYPPFLNFIMAWNRGINFGLGASGADWARWALIAVSLMISLGVVIWAAKRQEFWFSVGAGLVVGGALGNVIDRVQYGAVADFLNMSCCGINNPFVFNVADIAIFAGAALLILMGGEKKDEQAVNDDNA